MTDRQPQPSLLIVLDTAMANHIRLVAASIRYGMTASGPVIHTLLTLNREVARRAGLAEEEILEIAFDLAGDPSTALKPHPHAAPR
ncbi:MAG: hypothetical protein RLY86_1477 [Pseudomonadota bacterium]|jgi:hypothetical protein